MTMTPDQLIDLSRAALAGKTDALDRVYVPRTWPTRTDILPAILVRLVTSNKTSLGRGDVQFMVVDTLQIVLQAASLAAGDDTGLIAAEAQAWRIQRQIEVALINDGPLMAALQQIPFVNATVGHSSEGQQAIVEIHTRMGLEYYQGPEDFGGAYDGEEVFTEDLPELREVRIQTDIADEDAVVGPVGGGYPEQD